MGRGDPYEVLSFAGIGIWPTGSGPRPVGTNLLEFLFAGAGVVPRAATGSALEFRVERLLDMIVDVMYNSSM